MPRHEASGLKITKVPWLDFCFENWEVPLEKLEGAPKGYLQQLKFYREHEEEFRLIWVTEWRRLRGRLRVRSDRKSERDLITAKAAAMAQAKKKKEQATEDEELAALARERDEALERG